jgi:hypothetical protein
VDGQRSSPDDSTTKANGRQAGRARDVRAAFILGAGTATVLALVIAAALSTYAETTNDGGATAEIIEKALSILVGATFGLAIGAAFAAAVAPARAVLVGVAAGIVPYALVLVPIYVLTTPQGVSATAAAQVAGYIAAPVLVVVFLGAVIGWGAQRVLLH